MVNEARIPCLKRWRRKKKEMGGA